MKKLNIVDFVAFLLGIFVATLLKTSYAQLEDMLSHIQLLVVKTASTISLIMVITWLLMREFQRLFTENDQKRPSDEQQQQTHNRSFTETTP